MGAKKPNDFELHDTAGNVFEWVQDCYADTYAGAPADGSARKESNCSRRVVRGGSWGDEPPWLRSAYRDRYFPDTRHNYIGFRLAQD